MTSRDEAVKLVRRRHRWQSEADRTIRDFDAAHDKGLIHYDDELIEVVVDVDGVVFDADNFTEDYHDAVNGPFYRKREAT